MKGRHLEWNWNATQIIVIFNIPIHAWKKRAKTLFEILDNNRYINFTTSSRYTQQMEDN